MIVIGLIRSGDIEQENLKDEIKKFIEAKGLGPVDARVVTNHDDLNGVRDLMYEFDFISSEWD
jgi:hypothetical protein